jgi:DNA polymerase V
MSHKFTVLNGGKNKARTKGKGFEPEAEERLDLNRYLVKHPASTFYVRVSGDSMTGAGINPNDILVVDRFIKHKSGNIVIASINGELCVKRLRIKDGSAWLYPENPAYDPLEIAPVDKFEVWGVVTATIRFLNTEE